jgi:hypothetical protein
MADITKTFYILLIIIIIIYFIRINWAESYINYFPYANPFNKKFYLQDNPSSITFGAVANTFSDNFINFILRENNDKVIYEKDEGALIDTLNRGAIDITLVLEESMIEAKNKNNVLFVASLGKVEINILAHNDSGLYYLSDIKKKPDINYVINVIDKDSYNYTSCINLLHYLKITNYTFTYGDAKADIYYIIDSHPSTLIRKITDTIDCHFIGIPELNNGNPYMYTDDEYFFYYNNLQYQKSNMLNKRLFELYPKIFIINVNDIFTHTIKTKYLLLTNTFVKNNPKKNYMIGRYTQYIIYNLSIKTSPFYRNVNFESVKLMTPAELNVNNLKISSF